MDLAHERVTMVCIRMGDLCGVAPADVKDAFSALVIGTPLQNCRLEIEPVELVAFCPQCHKEQTIPDIHILKCPECGAATPRVVSAVESWRSRRLRLGIWRSCNKTWSVLEEILPKPKSERKKSVAGQPDDTGTGGHSSGSMSCALQLCLFLFF